MHALAAELTGAGHEAAAFPVADYTYGSVLRVFDAVRAHAWPTPARAEVRVALWNAGSGVFKPFLELSEAELADCLEGNVTAPFAFARQAVLAFRANALDGRGRRGTLLFTGATASVRGNVLTSAFAAGKHGLRALSQSLAKAFGKENIHVAHAIIDGGILTDRAAERREGQAREEYKTNEDIRLSPDSIAESYLYLVNQDRSAWTWEIDLRPAHEKW